MPITQKPFTPTRLEEEREDVIAVRLNAEERALIEELKELLNIKQDSKALKMAALVGRNVLHGTFGPKFLKWLFKNERSKLEE